MRSGLAHELHALAMQDAVVRKKPVPRAGLCPLGCGTACVDLSASETAVSTIDSCPLEHLLVR
jgi:hypothetical protein